jgi:hypothetical protein
MTTAEELTEAARAWLAGLDGDQRARATFPFDSDERFVWFYTPEPPRRGVSLGEMGADQATAAAAIVAASMSQRTTREIGSIIALEPVLGEIERAAGDSRWRRRDPGRYWFAVFGDPGAREPWSWRVGGHHIAINVTVARGEVVGATPAFLGPHPPVVPSGPHPGTATLPGEEALARELLAMLDAGQRRAAIVAERAPDDILTGNGRIADVGSVPVGVRHAELAGEGRAALERLIQHYLDRARPDVAAAAWERVVAPDLGDVTFAWAGPETPGHGHYYAVRGPRFVIEYDNTQDGANHVHAVWRELANDWGEDLLAAHLAVGHS